MKKKLYAIVACLLLLFGSALNVCAAPSNLPISYGNSYSMQVGGGLIHMSYPLQQIMK